MPDTEDFSSVMKVVLEPHDVPQKVHTPVGVVDGKISFNQYLVFVESDLIKNKSKKLLVGYIGKHDGANFCPITALGNFYGPQRDWIVAEAKRQHPNPSQEPWDQSIFAT